MVNTEFVLLTIFAVVVFTFLAFDLGFFNKKAHKVSFKSALLQTIFWIIISLIFAVLIFFFKSPDEAFQYLSAYLTEKTLSIDNLFVILLIFGYFNLEEKYYHKVLFWGIIGAIFLRGVFISAGAFIISQFHWVLYVFGAILLYTGAKMLFSKEDEKHIDMNKSKVIKFAKKYLPFTSDHHDGKFIHVSSKPHKESRGGFFGKWFFTDLFLIILLVETTDLIFAVDSIPAAFSITQNNFVIYTSNIFAILGLRSMFFLLSSVMHKFVYLKYALSFILVFIGAKMLVDIFHIKIPSLISFLVVLLSLLVAILASLMRPVVKR